MQVIMTSSFGTLPTAQQWNGLRNCLISVGVDVIIMQKAPSAENYLASFTAAAGIIYKDLFIPSRFYDPRDGEEIYFIKWFEDHKFRVIEGNIIGERKLASFEGSLDAVLDKKLKILWCGIGNRSSELFKETIINREFASTDIEPVSLHLKKTDMRSLNACLCPLESGGCIWYPEAFDAFSQNMIDLWYGENAIAVSELDARSFACNSISVGNALITPIISEELTDFLNSRGIIVIPILLSEFIQHGGACRSMILEVVQ